MEVSKLFLDSKLQMAWMADLESDLILTFFILFMMINFTASSIATSSVVKTEALLDNLISLV